jgi:hypothetical protein
LAAIIGAIAAYRVGHAQIIAAKQRDRLQARGIVVGVYPEFLELQVLHERAANVIKQWSTVDRRTMNTITLVPAIFNARIGLTPLLSRNVDNLFLVQPGAASGTDLTFGALRPGRNPPETLRSNGYHLLEFDH